MDRHMCQQDVELSQPHEWMAVKTRRKTVNRGVQDTLATPVGLQLLVCGMHSRQHDDLLVMRPALMHVHARPRGDSLHSPAMTRCFMCAKPS
jgi:hypothetical protein